MSVYWTHSKKRHRPLQKPNLKMEVTKKVPLLRQLKMYRLAKLNPHLQKGIPKFCIKSFSAKKKNLQKTKLPSDHLRKQLIKRLASYYIVLMETEDLDAGYKIGGSSQYYDIVSPELALWNLTSINLTNWKKDVKKFMSWEAWCMQSCTKWKKGST